MCPPNQRNACPPAAPSAVDPPPLSAAGGLWSLRHFTDPWPAADDTPDLREATGFAVSKSPGRHVKVGARPARVRPPPSAAPAFESAAVHPQSVSSTVPASSPPLQGIRCPGSVAPFFSAACLAPLRRPASLLHPQHGACLPCAGSGIPPPNHPPFPAPPRLCGHPCAPHSKLPPHGLQPHPFHTLHCSSRPAGLHPWQRCAMAGQGDNGFGNYPQPDPWFSTGFNPYFGSSSSQAPGTGGMLPPPHGLSGFSSAPPGSGGPNVPPFPYSGYEHHSLYFGAPPTNLQGIPPHPWCHGMVDPLHPSRRFQCLKFIAYTGNAIMGNLCHGLRLLWATISLLPQLPDVGSPQAKHAGRRRPPFLFRQATMSQMHPRMMTLDCRRTRPVEPTGMILERKRFVNYGWNKCSKETVKRVKCLV
ncbi:hypothetical protein PVAP13_6KG245036 [Panicum virgatum]|uniref:Uncharacterized protein n=1 Tax=Panicum virgatum TaxID=38727 RepID=A0A8T0RDY9_PANVG|nr:hypothetical protein PVAP13_6KG245036 [Panicum virgatum]